MAQLQGLLIFLIFLFHQWSIEGQSTTTQRFFNGRPKQFPYQVCIEKRDDCEWEFGCGGVVISKRIVLTSASCLDDVSINAIQIYFGAVNPANDKELGQQRLIVKRKYIVVHPEFDRKQHLNDLALIKLPVEIRFDDYIQPAKLPDPEQLYENEVGVVAGWSEALKDVPPYQLHYSNVSILSNEERQIVAHQYWTANFYPASWICSKPVQCSSYSGLTGDPLVVNDSEGSNILIGIMSFPLPSNYKAYNISTRVSSYLQWINQYEEHEETSTINISEHYYICGFHYDFSAIFNRQ